MAQLFLILLKTQWHYKNTALAKLKLIVIQGGYMDYSYNIAGIIISIALTAFFYIAPPAIYAFVIKKSRLPKGKAKKVCTISGVVIFLIFLAIYMAMGIDISGRTYGPALIWSTVAYFIIKEKDEIPNQANTVSTTQTSSTTEPVNKEETMDVCAIEKAVKGRYARIVSALKGTGITINEDIETAAVMISLADITANETEADRHALFEIVKNAIDKQANVV